MNTAHYIKQHSWLVLLVVSVALISTLGTSIASDTHMVENQLNGDENDLSRQNMGRTLGEWPPGTEQKFGGMVFCWIPPGSFLMGRYPGEHNSTIYEDPLHAVTFAKGFWMSKYPITQTQWQTIMGDNPAQYKGDNRPVENVSWEDIRGSGGYLEKLNTANPGYNFRLPSEAEWEYAYRAGTITRFYWGDDPNYTEIDDYAWYWDNSGTENGRESHEVGQKLPNNWGLHDMAGNVWEWCEDDWYSNYRNAPTDGSAWLDNPHIKKKILRGGAFIASPHLCRAAHRNFNYPVNNHHSYGLRIVCEQK